MKLTSIVAIVSIMMITGAFCSKAYAQPASPDFFIGKWEVIPEGTPMGEIKAILHIGQVNDTLKSWFTEETVPMNVSVEKTEMTGDSSMLFTWWDSMNGMEVYMKINKVAEDSISGTVMDMYPLTGKRIKE